VSDYDVIIVGAVLAGLTAGLFAVRYGLSTLVLEANIAGGHLVNIEKVEDFPGFPDGIAGYDLCPTVQRQAADQGAEFQRAEVQSLEAQQRFWFVVTEEERYRTKAVIAASGSKLKHLGVPGESRLLGKGVSHCAGCGGPLYQGETVGVIGGGDSALQEALALTRHVERVRLFHRGHDFSAQQAYQQRVLSHSKIDVRLGTIVEEILGDDIVSAVRVRSVATGAESQIELKGVFVYVGLEPNTAFIKNVVGLSDTGHVVTDVCMRTEIPGLYAVGDIRQDSPAQAITSAGEGAVAAITACRYIKETFA
jgi:thioredoxin reductase (NADPH)